MSDLMQAPPGDDLSSLGEVSTSNRSRLFAVVGVALGVVVLGLAAFFLFFSGGAEEEGGLVPSASQPQQQGEKPGKGDPAEDKIPPTYQGDVGRDPFQPLGAEEVVEAPAAEEDATASETDTDTSTDTGTTLAPDFYQVTIQKIGDTSATIVVNGVQYSVTKGERFPDQTTGPFQLVRIAPDHQSVTLKYGSETVTIPKGKAFVVKQG